MEIAIQPPRQVNSSRPSPAPINPSRSRSKRAFCVDGRNARHRWSIVKSKGGVSGMPAMSAVKVNFGLLQPPPSSDGEDRRPPQGLNSETDLAIAAALRAARRAAMRESPALRNLRSV